MGKNPAGGTIDATCNTFFRIDADALIAVQITRKTTKFIEEFIIDSVSVPDTGSVGNKCI